MYPLFRCGADSPFGLALPSAHPTPSQLYAPRGVWFDDRCLIVADTGNHRILIWHGIPDSSGTDADVVLGQLDFTSEGPSAGGRGSSNGLHLPTAVVVYEGRLIVADAWHHRVLVWNSIPQENSTPPSLVLGQSDMSSVDPNGGGSISAHTLYWPYGVGVTGNMFWIADTGNRRVLGWNGLPDPGQKASIILGQDNADSGEENRGGSPNAKSFRWPHAIAGDEQTLFIADAGNHRILGYTPLPQNDCDANLLLGQSAFSESTELPHRPQGAHRLRFPYSVASSDKQLWVADTANNRVLLWNDVPRDGIQRPANRVIGQTNFDSAGENRWQRVTDETLCWPYGIWLHKNRLAIADSGNNRIVMWDVSQSLFETTIGPEEIATESFPLSQSAGV